MKKTVEYKLKNLKEFLKYIDFFSNNNCATSLTQQDDGTYILKVFDIDEKLLKSFEPG